MAKRKKSIAFSNDDRFAFNTATIVSDSGTLVYTDENGEYAAILARVTSHAYPLTIPTPAPSVRVVIVRGDERIPVDGSLYTVEAAGNGGFVVTFSTAFDAILQAGDSVRVESGEDTK